MGKGKSSAAINLMNRGGRYIYVTPLLTECDRIVRACGFYQPMDDERSKLSDLKRLLSEGKNIAMTHVLFSLFDYKCRELVSRLGYTLIVDEAFNVYDGIAISSDDLSMLLANYIDSVPRPDFGRGVSSLVWRKNCMSYAGTFESLKQRILLGNVYLKTVGNQRVLIQILHPENLRVFDRVIFLTYLWEGQLQRTYLDFFNFQQKRLYVSSSGDSYEFCEDPCEPDEGGAAFRDLIRVVDSPKLNDIGAEETDLCKNWYIKNRAQLPELRKHMRSFFERRGSYPADCGRDKGKYRLWSTFKDYERVIAGSPPRYADSYLYLGARASNDYVDAVNLAYLCNLYANPAMLNFFEGTERINNDLYALSMMIQWIWRSAIRIGNPINLYLPSARMRELLSDWLERS